MRKVYHNIEQIISSLRLVQSSAVVKLLHQYIFPYARVIPMIAKPPAPVIRIKDPAA